MSYTLQIALTGLLEEISAINLKNVGFLSETRVLVKQLMSNTAQGFSLFDYAIRPTSIVTFQSFIKPECKENMMECHYF